MLLFQLCLKMGYYKRILLLQSSFLFFSFLFFLFFLFFPKFFFVFFFSYSFHRIHCRQINCFVFRLRICSNCCSKSRKICRTYISFSSLCHRFFCHCNFSKSINQFKDKSKLKLFTCLL